MDPTSPGTDPTTSTIARRGRGTAPPEGAATTGAPFRWADLAAQLRTGEATCWLSVRAPSGVHTRPVLAAWTGSALVLASRATAVKTRHLDADGRVSVAVGLPGAHLVLEGTATRLVAAADLERAATALREVFGWPTTVAGDEVDAPYGAPTSGGPPYRVYEVAPARGYAFPTEDQCEPTRLVF